MSGPSRFPEFRILIKQWLLIAFGVVVSSLLSDGIRFESWTSLIVAVLFISLLNVFLKPILVLLGLPFIIMTLGIGIILINALIFALTGYLVSGFEVAGFWPAVWGAFIVSLVTLVSNVLLARPKINFEGQSPGPPKAPKAKGGAKEYLGDKDDFIDI